MTKYTEDELKTMSIHSLRVVFRMNFGGAPRTMRKGEIIQKILDVQSGGEVPTRSTKGRKPLESQYAKKDEKELNLKDWTECVFEEEGGEKRDVRGFLELHVDGYGYLRDVNYNFESLKVFVAHTLINRYSLKSGDMIDGCSEDLSESNMKILRSVSFVNGKDPSFNEIENFNTFTARYPKERITLAKENQSGVEKVVDLFCPIGKGQRCLILDNGTNQKTALVKKIAESIRESQDVDLTVFLAGASPEEITDVKEGVSGEVVGTLFCNDGESLIRTFNLVVERAKREVERGKNKVLITLYYWKIKRNVFINQKIQYMLLKNLDNIQFCYYNESVTYMVIYSFRGGILKWKIK